MKDMKWGNVSHHYLCCHIYYYILYNEKAEEKPKKNRTEPWQQHTFTIHLSTFQPRCSAIFKLCPNFEMLTYMLFISDVVSTQNIV